MPLMVFNAPKKVGVLLERHYGPSEPHIFPCICFSSYSCVDTVSVVILAYSFLKKSLNPAAAGIGRGVIDKIAIR